jgi:poly [ADP-ribose] polymerase
MAKTISATDVPAILADFSKALPTSTLVAPAAKNPKKSPPPPKSATLVTSSAKTVHRTTPQKTSTPTTTTLTTPPKAPMPPTTSTDQIVREVRLIYSDVIGNNNKVWYGALYKNGDVYTEWGRVGKAMQTKTYPGAGSRKLDEKEREKLNKGYTPARVISTVAGGSSKTIANGNLQDIATKQISKGEPVLTKLVTMLVKANIHQITSHSQITYNDTTGLFQTPLGVVTSDAIAEAYRELNAIAQAMQSGQLTSTHNLDRVSRYLRLIPQDFGMRLDVNAMFPDAQAVQKQKDLLDSLEASYYALRSAKPTQASPANKDLDDTLFEVNVKVCDPQEVERIRKLYRKTHKSMHRYVANMDVKTAYEIHMPTQRDRFEKHGRPLGNVWELWHGTKMANVLNILRVGLKITPPKTAAIAGKMFGNGVYFSSESTKSLNYATDYWHGGGKGQGGTFYMFLANVAMGKYHVPKGPTSSRPPAGYHSYWAKPGHSGIQNPEMIVFDDAQHDLIRLVEFTENGR